MMMNYSENGKKIKLQRLLFKVMQKKIFKINLKIQFNQLP